jgi:hypothetical protein
MARKAYRSGRRDSKGRFVKMHLRQLRSVPGSVLPTSKYQKKKRKNTTKK